MVYHKRSIPDITRTGSEPAPVRVIFKIRTRKSRTGSEVHIIHCSISNSKYNSILYHQLVIPGTHIKAVSIMLCAMTRRMQLT